MRKSKRMGSLLLTVFCLTALLSDSLVQAAGSYQWPVPSSKTVTQKYNGSSHTGIDIGGSMGSQVVATKAGTVLYVYTGCINRNAAGSGGDCAAAGCSPNCGKYTKNGKKICNWGYGNGVIIKHADGSGYSMYAHMQSVSVRKGDSVAQGQALGTLGSSGYSTGAHLHFELTGSVQQSGTYFKPTSPINSNTSSISYVNAPGESGKISVDFSAATDPNYAGKAFVDYDNATVVTKVTKTSGASVSYSGIVLYGPDGAKLKEHLDPVTNVSDAQTTYHIWWDFQDELGITLQPGTSYSYQFIAVVNGTTYYSPKWSFTTKGTAPQPEPVTYPIYLYVYVDGEHTDTVTYENKTGNFRLSIGSSIQGCTLNHIEADYNYRTESGLYIFEGVDGPCTIRVYYISDPEPDSPLLDHFSYADHYAGYRDVSSTAWYAENVRSVTRLGLMSGVGGGKFSPESYITMGETLALATRLHLRYHTGLQDVSVTTIPWYQVYVAYAEENGLIDRNYDPTAYTDRNTFAKIFGGLLPDEAYGVKNPDIQFTDIQRCDDPEEVLRLAQAGIVVGVIDGAGRRMYQPDQPITRAEIAAIMSRIVDSDLRQQI